MNITTSQHLLVQSRRLLLITLAVAAALLAVHGISVAVGHPMRIGMPLHWLLEPGNLFGDSWDAMNLAHSFIQNGHADTVYTDTLARGWKFQYPPTSMLVFELVQSLGRSTLPASMNAFMWWFVFLVPASVWMAGRILGRWTLGHTTDAVTAAQITRNVSIALAVMSVFFYPTIKAFTLGQMQTYLNSAFCLAVVAFMTGRGRLAGLLIGLMCLIKPQFLLFAVWAWVRGRRDVLQGLLAPVIVGNIVSIYVYGIDMHLAYLRLLSQLSATGEAYLMNQSVNGLMNRLLDTGRSAQFESFSFAAYHPWVHVISTVATLFFVGLALASRPTHDRIDRVLDFVMAALCFTMASPIAWEHHYGILPIVFSVMLFVAFTRAPSAQRTLWLRWLGLSALACTFYLPVLRRIEESPWNLLQSMLFYGAVGCLALIVVMRRSLQTAPIEATLKAPAQAATA